MNSPPGFQPVEDISLVQLQNNSLRVWALADFRATREFSWDSLSSVHSSPWSVATEVHLFFVDSFVGFRPSSG